VTDPAPLTPLNAASTEEVHAPHVMPSTFRVVVAMCAVSRGSDEFVMMPYQRGCCESIWNKREWFEYYLRRSNEGYDDIVSGYVECGYVCRTSDRRLDEYTMDYLYRAEVRRKKSKQRKDGDKKGRALRKGGGRAK
jgi:hypothetical protein